MEAYSGFASVYDIFMDEVPYKEWCENLTELLAEYGIASGLVLDLGCGTGQMTRLLRNKGYDMIGIDISSEMLDRAGEQEESPASILYLQQDMRSFELYGTVRAIVSVCDTMNYLLNPEEVTSVCSLANNYLDPNGIFISVSYTHLTLPTTPYV